MLSKSKSFEKDIRQMRPLIILGMHRSGTSLTVRLLKDLGIHMGDKLSRDSEAIYFQMINRSIYNSVGSKWGDILGIEQAIRSEQFIHKQVDKVLNILFPAYSLNTQAGISEYFGPKLWEALTKGEDVYWAWKDPRTSFTFPIWLRVFPQARFLHIVRNGIDVAISTHRRTKKQQQSFLKRTLKLDYSPLTLDFNYCFKLWEEYTSFILDNKEIIPSGCYLELRYEDLLANPSENLRQITDYMEYPVQGELLEDACKQINRGRLDNASYAKPYQDIIPSLISSPLMQRLDYNYSIDMGDNEKVYEH